MGRHALIRSTAALSALAGAALLALPALPSGVALVLVAVALVRLGPRARPASLLGRRPLVLLVAVALLAGLLLLAPVGPGGVGPLELLLVLLAMASTLCLLGRLTPFSLFLLLLFGTTQVAGIAFVREGVAALGLVVAWVLGLGWTLLLFEREAAAARPLKPDGAVVVRRAATPAFARRRALATLLGTCLLGFGLGVLLYLVAPRGRAAEPEVATTEPALPAAAGDTEDLADTSVPVYATGPSRTAKGIQLGDVGEIKRDLTPFFEVRQSAERPPRLRENAYDRYIEGGWVDSREDDAVWLAPDEEGWITLDAAHATTPGERVTIRLLRGRNNRLFLPEATAALRIVRGLRPLRARVRRRANAQLDALVALARDDVVHAHVVDETVLDARRSAATADAPPAGAWDEMPASCAPLAEVARRVVGDAHTPWLQAQRLVAWLKSDAFTYTLAMPEVDTRAPTVAFVLEARRGHCEYFASALTLLLRSLGHPARIVRGFRGGDYQASNGTWLVRGSHYHAWTELWLDGLGWTTLDATPPDASAADASTITGVEATTGPEPARGLLRRLLDHEGVDWRALRERVAAGLARVRDALGAGGLAALGLFLALLLVRAARRRGQRGLEASGRAGPAPPRGPYARALHMLARTGLRRRPAWTGRELLAVVARQRPKAAAPLGRLTDLHERARFGGRMLDATARREARAALVELQHALREDGRRARRARQPA